MLSGWTFGETCTTESIHYISNVVTVSCKLILAAYNTTALTKLVSFLHFQPLAVWVAHPDGQI